MEKSLLKIPYVVKVIAEDGNRWLLEAEKGKDIRESVFLFAKEQNLRILSLMQEEQSMEDIFHSLTLHN
jgi:hypothetical protein